MSMRRKETLKTYFSVEGETEKWYFEWLQQEINKQDTRNFNVKFDIKTQKNPVARVKGLTVYDKITIIHILDEESTALSHQTAFKRTLGFMKKAKELKNGIRYELGYSNFSFELWMILHKRDCNRPLNHRRDYLNILKNAYGFDADSLDEYKEKSFFEQHILSALSIMDVRKAVERARNITASNRQIHTIQQYKGYTYYQDNPALSLGDVIGDILDKVFL